MFAIALDQRRRIASHPVLKNAQELIVPVEIGLQPRVAALGRPPLMQGCVKLQASILPTGSRGSRFPRPEPSFFRTDGRARQATRIAGHGFPAVREGHTGPACRRYRTAGPAAFGSDEAPRARSRDARRTASRRGVRLTFQARATAASRKGWPPASSPWRIDSTRRWNTPSADIGRTLHLCDERLDMRSCFA